MLQAKYIRLNNTACNKAPAPVGTGNRIYYYFERYPGLALQVTDKNLRTFYVLKKFGNATYRRKLIRLTELADVEEIVPVLEAERKLLNDGKDPRIERAKQAAKQTTYSELFDLYLQDAKDNGKKSQRKMEYAHNRYFECFNKLPVFAITRRDVQAWVKRLQSGSYKDTDKKTGNSKHVDGKSTARKNYAQLRAVLHWGEKQRHIKLVDDPTYGIALPRVKARERFIMPDEYDSFQAALEAEPDETMRDFFKMLLATGMRKSNVLSMQWNEINFDFQTWHIPDTKSGDSVTVTLTPAAMEILRRRRDQQLDDTWVFPSNKSKGRHIQEPKKHWKGLLGRAKLSDLRIHDLRRTVGSYMAIQGTSLPVIAKALGHKTVAATQIYSRLTLDPVREALQKAQESMVQAASQSKSAEVIPLAHKSKNG